MDSCDYGNVFRSRIPPLKRIVLQDFKSLMKEAGLVMMELVAMELKRQGRYFARTLGFYGVEFSLLKASMDPVLIQVGPQISQTSTQTFTIHKWHKHCDLTGL